MLSCPTSSLICSVFIYLLCSFMSPLPHNYTRLSIRHKNALRYELSFPLPFIFSVSGWRTNFLLSFSLYYARQVALSPSLSSLLEEYRILSSPEPSKCKATTSQRLDTLEQNSFQSRSPGTWTTMQTGSNESKQFRGVSHAGKQRHHSPAIQSFKKAEKAEDKHIFIVFFMYLRRICSSRLISHLHGECQALAASVTVKLCQNNTARALLSKGFSPHSIYLSLAWSMHHTDK